METVIPFNKSGKRRPSKADRQKELASKVLAQPTDEKTTTPAVAERTTEPAPAPAIPAPPEPTAEPASKAESKPDSKTKDSKPKNKKPSETVTNWRAQAAFKPESVITLIASNVPKSGKAALRFKKYQNNMTVKAYQDLIKDSYQRTFKQTMDDIRWDFVSGFIKIDGKSFK